MERQDVAGHAALVVMEALLAQLVERGVLTPDDVDRVFDSAVGALETAAEEGTDGHNAKAARLIEKVWRGANGVNRV